MWEVLGNNVLGPLFTRLGTLATGALIGIGASTTHSEWVGTGIAGALFIAADLGLAWLRKRRIQDKTFAQTVERILTGKITP